MTTYEWISFLAVIIGGFWTLNRQLTQIELALKGKVSYDICSSRQEKCPCHDQIKKILENFEKFHPRKKRRMNVKKLLIFAAAAAVLLLSGCKTSETLAKGVSAKSISASGVFTLNRAGLDTTTQTPELLSLFIWGDYTSVMPGDEIFRYEESEDASVFNSASITRNKKIFFATGDKARMDAVIKSVTQTKEVNK